MAFIPESVRATPLITALTDAGLRHLNSGKTGELFELPNPELLLLVKTDRISIFDFVLPATIHDKGSILTAMTILWIEKVLPTGKFAGNHLVAFGKDINGHIPAKLQNSGVLDPTTALVIRRMESPNIECIVRGNLTGSALKPYLETGIVCGHTLPPGLHDGSKLPEPIFTPTTKAAVGHDEHINYLAVRASHGMTPETVSLAFYDVASKYAAERGIVIADTKLELGPNGELIDEVFTPDTSRFWLESEWEKSQGMDPPKSPDGFDKQHIRDWGKKIITPFIDAAGKTIIGINKLNPKNEEHVTFVSNIAVGQDILDATSQLYHQCLPQLFETTLDEFWENHL